MVSLKSKRIGSNDEILFQNVTAIIAVSSVGLTRRAKSMKLVNRNNGFYSILDDSN